MSKPSLLILAAGLGSRYKGFKQIDPIGPGGEIIIDYAIYDALRAGFGKIVMLTRPELEAPIRDHLRQTLGEAIPLAFVFQRLDDLPDGFASSPDRQDRQKPWGTGHAVWAARHEIDAPFGVINADDFYGPGSYRILGDFLAAKRPGEYGLIGFELAKTLSDHGTVSRGICQADADGYLSGMVEHTRVEPDAIYGARSQDASGAWHPLAADSIASMNLWGFDPSVMGYLEGQFREFLASRAGDPKAEFFISTAIDTLIQSGKVRCKILKTGEQWFGMTYPQDREVAKTAIQRLIGEGVYPARLR